MCTGTHARKTMPPKVAGLAGEGRDVCIIRQGYATREDRIFNFDVCFFPCYRRSVTYKIYKSPRCRILICEDAEERVVSAPLISLSLDSVTRRSSHMRRCKGGTLVSAPLISRTQLDGVGSSW